MSAPYLNDCRPGLTPDDVVQKILAISDLVIDHNTAPASALRVLIELAFCCEGAAMYGPERCTCWTPVFDLEETEPDTTTVAGARTEPCADCAYRPDSPERNGSDAYALSEPGELDRLVETGQPFWCHVGMRKPIAYEHPAGIRITAHEDHYQPPILNGVPYTAAGAAGSLCAGWLARRLRQMTGNGAEVQTSVEQGPSVE